ncbi:MAG TPA: hypothetical protein VMU05_04780 [Dongiaceae bacterium]|nr:hypothetical protein [Dongiaceae bacterium]
MPKPSKNRQSSPGDSDIALLAWLATCASVFTFLFFFKNGEVLLYGDAVAHINIARRVFDSKTPGLLQLGTVWLPLPHLLMIPFLISMKMWRTGAGGSIPSMIAYVLGTVGMFRLVRNALTGVDSGDAMVRASAWIAALIYAANPNLMYMQSTGMGEVIYLAFFIWAISYLCEWLRGGTKALMKCGLCLAGACLTRYDGWFLSGAVVVVVLIRAWYASRDSAAADGGTSARGKTSPQGRANQNRSTGASLSGAAAIRFLLITAAAPALWLAYNGIVYRNPLEFENGPYSAKAIERRTQSAANPGHPGAGNLFLAGGYFVKAAEDNVASNEWLQRIWVLLLLACVIVPIVFVRRESWRAAVISAWPLLLLLVPIAFYALSIAYSGVPIFVPQWWPFSHYNVRYGLQLLPAFSAAIAVLISINLRAEAWNWRLRFAGVLALLAFVFASYSRIWLAGPICLQEAQINMRTRNQLEIQLSTWLEKLPAQATLLMYLGDHVGAVERAGIPLSHTINEGNHRVWKQPTDPEGLWERALADPTKYADYVLAFEGDPVWQAVHNLHLRELVEVHVTGQARAVLYRAR